MIYINRYEKFVATANTEDMANTTRTVLVVLSKDNSSRDSVDGSSSVDGLLVGPWL